jgi:hypothetical protein
MKYKKQVLVTSLFAGLIVLGVSQCTKVEKQEVTNTSELTALSSFAKEGNQKTIQEGQDIFRFDSFGDEDFWSSLLHIDKAIEGRANGGFGGGVSPVTALAVGLKVDVDALPASIQTAIRNGSINLNDPATTLALLKLNAVVGVKGNFNGEGHMQSLGITCASCHSTVDNSFAPGIGHRLDGWPNRDLNVGAIVNLTDNATPIASMLHVTETTLRQVLSQWGPGKFPAILFMDGKAYTPDGKIAANLIPAAFGLRGINLTTYTGWGDISYWNSFVANLEMHGKGTFNDPRLNDPVKYPIAFENHFYNVVNTPDLITSKLFPLRAYQHSLDAPKPPDGSFDQSSAVRGKRLFLTNANCVTCHSLPLYADNMLHSGSEIGIDNFEADRSPTGKYRTTPLDGLFAKMKGGFYHDGRFATLADVVNHYNIALDLNLTATEKSDLVEYLKSL